MTFVRYTGNQAALTSVREQNNFTRMLAKGVYSGFRAYPDATTTNYAVSIFGGFAALKGVLIEDDQDNLEVLNLGAPVDATGDHHLIWIDNSGDVPVYAYKTGTYSSLAALNSSETENGIPIADVYIPNGATSIQDAIIINRDRILSNEELSNRAGMHIRATVDSLKVVDSGGNYTLSFGGLQLVGINPTDSGRFPVSQIVLSTSSASGDPGYDWEITQADNAADYVIFYTNDTNGFTQNSTIKSITQLSLSDTELANLAGSSTDAVSASDDVFPNRSELWDAYIIAIVDTTSDAVHTPFGTLAVGDELVNGVLVNYTKTISSTAYGTTANAASGAIDIDSVIDNAAKLHNATLDTAYDGFEAGAAAAAGRTINVDGPPVQLIRTGLSDGAVDDKWQASLQIYMNNGGVTDGAKRERGIDIVINDNSGNQDRVGASVRKAAQVDGNLLAGSTTWDLVGGEIQATTIAGLPSGVTVADVLGAYDEFTYVEEIENWYVEFGGTGSDCDNRVYKMRVNTTGGYFYLEDPDGATTGISAQFPVAPFSATTVVFRRVAELGDTSIFSSIEVDSIRRKGGGTLLTTGLGFQSGIRGPYGLIENGNGEAMLPIFPFSTKPLERANIASIGTGAAYIDSDGKYLFLSKNVGVGAEQEIDLYRTDSGAYVRTLTTNIANGAARIAASGGFCWAYYVSPAGSTPTVEVFNVETGGTEGTFTLPAPLNAIDSTGVQAFAACDDDGVNNVHRLSTTAITASQGLGTTLDATDVACFGGKIAFVMSDGRGFAGLISTTDVVDQTYNNSLWSNFSFTSASRCFVGPSGTYFVGITGDPAVYIGKASPDANEREVKVRVNGADLDSLSGFELHADDQRLYALGRPSGVSVDYILIYTEADFSPYAQNEVNRATETYNYLTTDGLYLYSLDVSNSILYRLYTGRAAGLWVEDYDNAYPRRVVPAGGFLT